MYKVDLTVDEILTLQLALKDRIDQLETVLLLIRGKTYVEEYKQQLALLKSVEAKLTEQVPF